MSTSIRSKSIKQQNNKLKIKVVIMSCYRKKGWTKAGECKEYKSSVIIHADLLITVLFAYFHGVITKSTLSLSKVSQFGHYIIKSLYLWKKGSEEDTAVSNELSLSWFLLGIFFL